MTAASCGLQERRATGGTSYIILSLSLTHTHRVSVFLSLSVCPSQRDRMAEGSAPDG